MNSLTFNKYLLRLCERLLSDTQSHGHTQYEITPPIGDVDIVQSIWLKNVSTPVGLNDVMAFSLHLVNNQDGSVEILAIQHRVPPLRPWVCDQIELLRASIAEVFSKSGGWASIPSSLFGCQIAYAPSSHELVDLIERGVLS